MLSWRIEFNNNSVNLSTAVRSKLDNMISVAKLYTDCNIIVTRHYSDFCNKCGALAWDRAKAVATYFYSKGIDAGKLLFITQFEGNLNYLTIKLGVWDSIVR